MQFWKLITSSPTKAAFAARRAEEAGWDGVLVVDSQNLAGDAYVCLTAMALATKTIGIGTGVTNPVTRHPAVTASAIASIQRLSAGRAVLGIGRGDSALAHLGKAPARLKLFENYLSVLQSYLRKENVPFDALEFNEQIAPDVATLGLADTPDTSALRWLNERDTKVPVEVAATGPKVIAIAATYADQVMLALGADSQRLGWGIETARQAAKKAGRSVNLGAYINIVCHPDVSVARALVQGGLSTFARFSVMHGQVRGDISESQESVLNQLHDAYDMNEHTRSDSKQAIILTDEFIDQYSIVGPPEHCLNRLRELNDMGIDKITVIGPSAGADKQASLEAEELLTNEVLKVL